MKKLRFLIAFMLSISLFLGSTLTCFASGYSDWSSKDKRDYFFQNINSFLLNVGFSYFYNVSYNDQTFLDTCLNQIYADKYTDGYDSYNDFLANLYNITDKVVSSDGSIVSEGVSSGKAGHVIEPTSLGTEVINQLVFELKNDLPYEDVSSVPFSKFLSSFEKKECYDSIYKYLGGYNSDWVNICNSVAIYSSNNFYMGFSPQFANHNIYFLSSFKTSSGIRYNVYDQEASSYPFIPVIGWHDMSSYLTYVNNIDYLSDCVKISVFDYNGNNITDAFSDYVVENGYDSLVEYYYKGLGFSYGFSLAFYTPRKNLISNRFIVDQVSTKYRLYDTLSDLKQYETGNPFYYEYDSDTLPVLTTSNIQSYVNQVQANTYYNGNTYYYYTVTPSPYYPTNPNYPSYPSAPGYPSNPSNPGDGGGGSPSDPEDGGGINLGWLGKLGEIIGKVIQAIGEFIVGLLDGVVGLLDDIGEFGKHIIEALDSNVMGVFRAVLDFIPEPVLNAIWFGMIASILAIVIKKFL